MIWSYPVFLFPTTLNHESYAPIKLNHQLFLVHTEYLNTSMPLLRLFPLPTPSLPFLHT